MSQRHEFVVLAGQSDLSFCELCRRFGISRKTGYKWVQRFQAQGQDGLRDQSRRPRHSPGLCPPEVAEAVIATRREEPTWGGRKLRRRLQDLGYTSVPAASTCTQVVRRAGLLEQSKAERGPFQRFEREHPNELWQMDHKGDFATQSGARCYPLTVVDDCSRFNLVLEACANQRAATVQAALIAAFRRYGLPQSILCDNGPPWGRSEPVCPHTGLTVWLLQIGVTVKHGRPYHPQTQGKEERFHRTLAHELLVRHTWSDLAHCAREFPKFRSRYNFTRPHDSLSGDTPAARYRPSPRAYPASMPPLEYPLSDVIKRVRTDGSIYFQKRQWYIGRAFAGLTIGLRPSAQADGQCLVFFGPHQLGGFDLTTPARCAGFAESIYGPHPNL
jgi:transposase InsO family protein